MLYLCSVGQWSPTGKQCKVMMIKYDIQHLSNAQGKGISRPYVQLTMQHLSPPAELEEMAERNTTLTRADMRAALSVVAEFVESQLALKISCVPAIPLFGGGYVEERWSIGNFLS